jgi:glycosyltransferase involved in cell wall biosynthesis
VRILVLHSRYRSGAASGENRVVDDETELLRQAGHKVEVLAPSLEGARGLDLARAGARIVWAPGAAGRVKRILRRGDAQPDIVHCHNLFPALSPAVLREVQDCAPLVMTLHNYRLLCLPATFLRDGRICEDCLRRVPWPGVLHQCYQDSVAASAALASSLLLHRGVGTFSRVDLFLAISSFIKAKHVEGGLPPDRIMVKRHFVWPTPRREGPGDYFLFVGRLSPEKGAGVLVRAWRRLNANLVVVGDGPEAARLRSEAPSNVTFEGPATPDGVALWARRARALVVPSIWYEAAGRVVLEAYAAGVPVLASLVGGLPEVVQDGVTGLLLPPGSEGEWIRGAERLMEDSESERMGEAAWSVWKDQYSPVQGLLNLQNAYDRVLRQ